MKKVISLILCAVLLVAVFSLAGCGEKGGNLKLGLGVHSYVGSPASAEGDKDGSAEIVSTAAAVLLDEQGKIVKAVIDCAANTLKFTAAGEYVAAGEYATKREQGDSYGMKAYASSPKEWYEQADAFAELIVGKTVQEVKTMVATDGKGNTDVVNAGCTIEISDFVLAVEKAIENAVDSSASKNDTLKLGVVSVQTGEKSAEGDAQGVNEADTTVVAATLNKDGKVSAMLTDALAGVVNFDASGKVLTEDGKAITTKRDAGTQYGMAQYGNDLNGDNVVKEWFEQAEAFNKACIGKNSQEIAALATENGYGTDELQTAGCTINIADFVKAAVKACTIE